MTRATANRICFTLPLVFSALAFAVVIANVAAGVKPSPDENASAHIFQLLILAQVPFIAAFLLSSRQSPATAASRFGLQLVGIAIALLPVWLAGY